MKASSVITKKLRPTNHYLDLIAKIQMNNGTVSNLCVQSANEDTLVEFSHSYPISKKTFTEKIVYNHNKEILNWTITIDMIKEICIYSEANL